MDVWPVKVTSFDGGVGGALTSGSIGAAMHFDCTNCQGSIDFAGSVSHALVASGVCPMCRGEVRLGGRCAGNLEEVAGEWWLFCDCCLSYWLFMVPEPTPGKVSMDSGVTL